MRTPVPASPVSARPVSARSTGMLLTQLAAAGLLAMIVSGCREDKATATGQGTAAPPVVGVTAVTRKDLAVGASFVGRVAALDAVDVRARVSGFLGRRMFEEGRDIRAADLLFVIEPATYQAQLEQARANVARAEADAANAAVQLQRALELSRNRNISEATVDERRADDAMAKATVLQQKAALKQAEISLGYTEVRSPIAGRIGRARYTEGALVGPESGPLVSVVRQDPVSVTFPITQRELLAFRRGDGAEGRGPSEMVVRLILADGKPYPQAGRIDFLDVRVDQGTDTQILRAIFPNPDRLLVDGQSVSVSVEREVPEAMLVVPQAALQTDQSGPFVLVVGEDRKVAVRRVTLGQGLRGEVVVRSGLSAGEQVVVQGIQKARPGQPVEPSPIPGPAGA